MGKVGGVSDRNGDLEVMLRLRMKEADSASDPRRRRDYTDRNQNPDLSETRRKEGINGHKQVEAQLSKKK